jgi:hypothetical protein
MKIILLSFVIGLMILFGITFAQSTTNEVWWLHVYFTIDGENIHGSAIDGWQARQIGSFESCDALRGIMQNEMSISLPDLTIWLCLPSHIPADI